jgi:putative salt-induced outer membrane protein
MKSKMTRTGVKLVRISSAGRGTPGLEAPASILAEEHKPANYGTALFSRRILPFVAGALLVPTAMLCGLAQAQPVSAPEKKPTWESSAFAGLTLTRGNSETLLGNVNILTTKKWDHNELSLGADGTYGETKLPGATNSAKNAESIHGFGQYNRLFNERLYGLGRVDALHDGIADVEYRVTLSVGVGYYFVKTTNTVLSGEVGPGYVFEKLGSTEHNYATMRVGEKFTQKLSSHARLWQSAEFLPQIDDFDNYLINAEIGVEADITAHLSLSTFVQDTYKNRPAPGRKQNDLKLVAGVKYKF